jgi:hypothetical protein
MCVGYDTVCCLTLAVLAISNTLDHGKILRIITPSKSILNSFDIGTDVSIEMVVQSSLRAVGAITLRNLCSLYQYEIPQQCSTRVKTEGKRDVLIWVIRIFYQCFLEPRPTGR